jgi:hypothetical protein
MMVEGAEERQLKGPIDVLAPYTSKGHKAATIWSSRVRGAPRCTTRTFASTGTG